MITPNEVKFAFPKGSRGQVNTLVGFKSLHFPGQYTIFPAENSKIILIDLQNIIFESEARKKKFKCSDRIYQPRLSKPVFLLTFTIKTDFPSNFLTQFYEMLVI